MSTGAQADPSGQPAPDDGRGRAATSPLGVPLAGWKEIAIRTWNESSSDSIGLIAAGVSFYGFLALVPLLGAVVLTYGLVADPATVMSNMAAITAILPAEVAKLIGDQLMNVVSTSGDKKGLGVAIALALALYGARNAAGGVIQALNIAYEEKEKRGFFAVNALALIITAAVVVVFVVALFAAAAVGLLGHVIPTGNPILTLSIKIASNMALALAAAAAAATLYRYGASRANPRWKWLTPGSVLFAVAWVILTLGFGIYVSRFGDYGATYGSLSAVVVLLTWLYLSSYALLFGAELNAELEHQTARDTTEGPERPLGQRKAWAADHVARGAHDAGEVRDAKSPATAKLGGTNEASAGRSAPPPPRADLRTDLRDRVGRRLAGIRQQHEAEEA